MLRQGPVSNGAAVVATAPHAEVERFVRYLVWGQFCFLATMSVCWAIEPSWAAVRLGLSYYGSDLSTVGPYVIGFALCIGLSAFGLARIRTNAVGVRRFRRAVAVVLGLMALIPLTPYSVDHIFDWLHIGAAAALFTAGLTFGARLTFRLIRDRFAWALFGFQTISAVAIFAAQLGLNEYMIPSELSFQLSVVGLVVRGVRRLAV